MRIGFLYQAAGANHLYRAIGPAEALQRRGFDVVRGIQKEDATLPPLGAFLECDVIHVYRLANAPARQWAETLRQSGVALTWDNDDDLRNMPEGRLRQLGLGAYGAQQVFREQVALMRRAHAVTTPSDRLAELYRRSGVPQVVKIENFLGPRQYAGPTEPRPDGTCTIGWVAGLEHHRDAKALQVSRVLRALMERHPKLRVVTVGVRLDLEAPRYVHYPRVQFHELPTMVRTFDIGIAPISDLLLNQQRSNIKVKEYAAAGVPWLASARGSYLGLGPEQGGVLVADDDWERILERMVTSPTLRANLRTRGVRWAASQSIDLHVGQWITVFQHAAEAARASAHDQGAIR